VNVAMEIVNNYDIDGLHLDYVRWNEHSDLSLSGPEPDPVAEISVLDQEPDPEVIEALQSLRAGRYLYDVEHTYHSGVPTGYGSWPQWWRASVTAFVQSLHDSMQVVKPHVRLSVAALGKYNWSGWNGYDVVYQDAALWFNEGYIDQLTPMHYHWTTNAGFLGMLTGDCPYCWSEYIQPGVNAGRLYSVGPGSYIFDSQGVWHRHPGIVNTCRGVHFVDGFQFFSYGSWQDYLYWDEAGETFFGTLTKIRPSGLYDTEAPDAPSLVLVPEDQLNYIVEVTPPAGISEGHWMVVYRSAATGISTTESEIVYRGFVESDDAVLVQQSFDGTQDHDGSYFYAATMLDRFWNESDLSNEVQSDPLPSYAPEILSSTPVDGETVDVNTPIMIQFSKTMDVAATEAAISLTPEPSGGIEFIWSEGDHVVELATEQNLEFLTSYTLSVTGSEALDINGTPMESSFSIDFTTREVDTVPPEIMLAYPNAETMPGSFDVDAPFSYVFNEYLDPESINETTVTLTQDGVGIDIDMLLSEGDGYNLLDIKAWDVLDSDAEFELTLGADIADTSGNALGEDLVIPVSTVNEHYGEVLTLDRFTTTGEWWDPEGSGSTVGTVGSNTNWGYSTDIYLPASSNNPGGLRAGFINYEWDTTATYHLLREYIPSGTPRNITYDTTYTLQCYIYGDGSMNQFRFALDEAIGADWPNHEVSQWLTIDWEGWRLVEWRLSDPTSVGVWIGNEALDGTLYRMDSFQMTYDPEIGSASGRIYLDNLRSVRKLPGVSIKTEPQAAVPTSLTLHPAHPNPFNPETQIRFDVPADEDIQLNVYDVQGRLVRQLHAGHMTAGSYTARFSGESLASGVYFIRLETRTAAETQRVLLLK